MARDVFISYRSEDKATASRICAALERENISCWMAPRDIRAGEEWATAIVGGLERSKAFVLILSSNSKNAKQISREAELADQNGLPIITFRIEDVQPPPGLLYFLGNIQWLDAFGDQFDAAVGHLVEVVRQSASYPAEKTRVSAAAPAREILPITAEPEFAPVPPPIAESSGGAAEGDRRRNGTGRWIAIAVAVVVVLGVVGWLLARHAKPKPAPDAAKAVARRFINERDSGDYEAAWAETAPGFNNGVSKENWIANAQHIERAGGKVQRLRLEECKAGHDSGTYACLYTLFYASGGSGLETITVKPKDDGSWAVWRSGIRRQ